MGRQVRHCFRATSIRYNFSIKMPGKEIIGVVFEFRREEEGEYVCPKTTVFGLKREEIASSGYNVMRHLGLLFGFAPLGNPLKTDLKIEDTKKPRMSMMATLARDIA